MLEPSIQELLQQVIVDFNTRNNEMVNTDPFANPNELYPAVGDHVIDRRIDHLNAFSYAAEMLVVALKTHYFADQEANALRNLVTEAEVNGYTVKLALDILASVGLLVGQRLYAAERNPFIQPPGVEYVSKLYRDALVRAESYRNELAAAADIKSLDFLNQANATFATITARTLKLNKEYEQRRAHLPQVDKFYVPSYTGPSGLVLEDIQTGQPQLSRARIGRHPQRDHLWARIVGVPYLPNFTYRLFRHRAQGSGGEGLGKWVIASSSVWSETKREQLKALIVKHGFENLPDTYQHGSGAVFFHRPDQLRVEQVEILDQPGIYFKRSRKHGGLQINLDDPYLDFCIVR